MGCLKTVAILTSVCVIGLSVYLYSPIPEGISEPWKIRSVLATSRFIELMCAVSEMTGYDSRLNVTRKVLKMVAQSPPPSMSDPLLKVTDTTFDGIKVRMYRPKNAKTPSPALVYFHGGGWNTGNIDLIDAFAAEIAKSANIVVVSVDYRLAPEHPFPIPFEDCVTATLHLLQNYDQYGVHGDKIAVGGDSAGGNLAAATALLISSNNQLPNISLQVLIYPMLQPLNFKMPSYRDSMKYFFTKPTIITEAWSYYLGPTTHPNLAQAMLDNQHTSPLIKKSFFADIVNVSLNMPKEFLGEVEPEDLDSGNETLWKEIENKVLNPYMAPLLGHEVDKVPPAIVVSAEYDVLLDETILYAERLRKAGVKVKHRHYKMFHGFLTMVHAFESAVNATRDICGDIDRHFSMVETE